MQGNGTDASFNLGQASYRYPASFVHCSNFKDVKIHRLYPVLEILFFSENNKKTTADFNTSTIFIIKFYRYVFQ